MRAVLYVAGGATVGAGLALVAVWWMFRDTFR